jgi:hypothetical protein
LIVVPSSAGIRKNGAGAVCISPQNFANVAG